MTLSDRFPWLCLECHLRLDRDHHHSTNDANSRFYSLPRVCPRPCLRVCLREGRHRRNRISRETISLRGRSGRWSAAVTPPEPVRMQGSFLPYGHWAVPAACLPGGVELSVSTEPSTFSSAPSNIADQHRDSFSRVYPLGWFAMLRRHSTKSSGRSVHLEHLDANLAQRDATIAAAHAFVRGQARPGPEMSLFPVLLAPSPPRRESRIPRSRSFAHQGTNSESAEDRRQQSVRFVGPSSSHRRHGGPRHARTDPSSSLDEDTTLLASPSRTDSQAARCLGVLRSTENMRTALPSAEKDGRFPARALASAYLDALEAGDEYYTAEDDIASAPSSYRRLRRSQSLFCRGTSTDAYLDDPPRADGSASCSPERRTLPLSATMSRLRELDSNKENKQPLASPPAFPLRAPKSMSFLRGRRRTGSQGSIQTDKGEGRPCLTSESGPRRNNSKTAHGPIGMRKSLRSSSSNSAIPAFVTTAPAALEVPKGERSLRNKARKVSRNLKSKLKSLFHLSKGEVEPPGLPEQHIETRKCHASRRFRSPPSSAGGIDGEAHAAGSISRVPSSVASLHVVRPEDALHSRRGSIESLSGEHDVADEKSRVTSWASSNVASVASQQQAWNEWERQRLSVIKENGIHSPSPSFSRRNLHTPPTRPPYTSETTAPLTKVLPGPTVDSQRVYSALMKRLKETRQLENVTERQRRSSGEQSDPFRTASPATSTCSRLDLKELSTPTPTTIKRHSPPNGGISRVIPKRSHNESPMSRRMLAVFDTENPWEGLENDHGPNHDISGAAPVTYSAYPPAAPKDGQGLSPPIEFVLRGNGSPSKGGALSDGNSVFFGSPSRHLFRTTSPYRRALQETMAAVIPVLATAPRESPSSPSPGRERPELTVTRCSDVFNAAYSESAYSSQIGDGMTRIDLRSLADEFPEPPPSNSGDGNVFVDAPAHLAGDHRLGSPGSSVDWKTWLDANASRLEPQFSPTRSERRSEVEYLLPQVPKGFRQGHVRERAQLYGDDDDMSPQTNRPSPPPSPFIGGPTTGDLPPVPQPMSWAESPCLPPLQAVDQSPPRGTTTEASDISSGPSCHVPPIPPKSSLRPKPSTSLASMKSTHDATAKPQNPPQTPGQGAAARRSKSLAHIRSLNRMRGNNTGSPYAPASASSRLARWAGRTPGYSVPDSTASSPGLTMAVERQFGGLLGEDKENVPVDRKTSGAHGTHAPGRADVDAQAMGSKRIVELFLSSRRQRMVSTEDADAFI